MIRQFAVLRLHDHMRTGHLLGMKPPVIPCGKLKGKLIILEIIFSHINIISILSHIMERLRLTLRLLPLPAVIMLLNIPILHQLFLDLCQITLSQSNIQSIGNRLQMLNLTSRICNLLSQSLLRTLQLSILVKILLGILRRSHSRIKRNGNLLIGIIIQSLKRLTSILQPIPISIDQLPVNLILLFLRSILHLLLLQTQLLTVTLQRSLHDPPQIRRLLMDTRQRILRRIISLQHL